LLLKDISTSAEEDIDAISKRIIYLLQSISDETLNALKKGEKDLEYLEDMEKNINKFTEYCFRVLNKKGYPKKVGVMYCMIFLFETLGDDYKRLIIDLERFKTNPKLTALFEKINSYHHDMTRLYLKYTKEKGLALAKVHDGLIVRTSNGLKSANSSAAIILKDYEHIISTIIRIMNELMNFY